LFELLGREEGIARDRCHSVTCTLLDKPFVGSHHMFHCASFQWIHEQLLACNINQHEHSLDSVVLGIIDHNNIDLERVGASGCFEELDGLSFERCIYLMQLLVLKKIDRLFVLKPLYPSISKFAAACACSRSYNQAVFGTLRQAPSWCIVHAVNIIIISNFSSCCQMTGHTDRAP
jgi:hypothetical protein